MDQRKSYDVIVTGGGPSGVAAAVAAARNGCKTLLIERGSDTGAGARIRPLYKCGSGFDWRNRERSFREDEKRGI